ncbi:MAG: hypothetical protein BWY31_03686 [Lentisphaerae bacterium ADurb.Bin242]|nr:MAG: hypothetical protein BWY31_03686 [Lentisphaerae bacterium ADurb.Bin242]
MFIPRTLEPIFMKQNQLFPVMLVAGPRQVGKTTMLKHLAEAGRTYVTLDDPMIQTLAKTDPKTFLDRYPAPLLIDEIQYAPELLPYIKMKVDNDSTPGQFWLTGSQQFQMMKGVTESLAGRVGILNLYGFSQDELKRRPCKPFLPRSTYKNATEELNIVDFFHQIWKGSYPKLAGAGDDFWEVYYASYLQTYVERDVRALTNIAKRTDFYKFVQLAAARTGQILNYTNLVKDSGLAQGTVRNYLSILEASNLIFFLQPYFNNINKRLTKTPKMYFLDTGLAAYLTGWSNPKVLEAGAMAGAFFETWCISELIKTYVHNGKRPSFYFYHDKDDREIDLVIEQDGTLYPIEFKKASNPGREDIRYFSVLEQFKKPIGPGAVICGISNWVPITKEVIAVPATLI